MVPTSELNKNPKIGPELAAAQTGLTAFFKDLVTALADDNRIEDDIPVSFLASAQRLANVVTKNNPSDVMAFLEEPRRANAVAAAVHRVLIEKAGAALPKNKSWAGTQRMFAAWLCIATYPNEKLKESFANFRAPLEFENHLSNMSRRWVGANENAFDNVLFQWIVQREPELPGLMAFEVKEGELWGMSPQPHSLIYSLYLFIYFIIFCY
jgi:hypothetical protein